jgi:hypothetical protein
MVCAFRSFEAQVPTLQPLVKIKTEPGLEVSEPLSGRHHFTRHWHAARHNRPEASSTIIANSHPTFRGVPPRSLRSRAVARAWRGVWGGNTGLRIRAGRGPPAARTSTRRAMRRCVVSPRRTLGWVVFGSTCFRALAPPLVSVDMGGVCVMCSPCPSCPSGQGPDQGIAVAQEGQEEGRAA